MLLINKSIITRSIKFSTTITCIIRSTNCKLNRFRRAASKRRQQQQGLTAQQQLLSRQALQPLEAAQQFGSGVTQLIAGYPGRENILPPAAAPSPLATGLGTASTLAGIYRLIQGSK